MKTKQRDKDGNLYYKCWKCKKDINFKAMRYINVSMECPHCESKIKLK